MTDAAVRWTRGESVRAPSGPPHAFKVSVVIPVYNERGSLQQLYTELVQVLPEVVREFELVFVDDGSTDGSLELLLGLAETDKRVRVFGFRSNQGKAESLNLGFGEATGDVVVTMDADLQDKPSEIPRLLAALDGNDLVSGWKRVRHDPIGKTLPSKLFNWVTSMVSGVRLHDFNCGLKAYRREVVAELDLYGELHRFIPVIAARRGFRITEVQVDHAPRAWGRSKYGFTRLFKGAYDLLTVMLLTRFETRPLHFFGTVGLGIGSAGMAILLYMSYLRVVLHQTIGHRPLLFLGIVLLLAGIELFSAGLVGELVVRRTRQRRQWLPLRASSQPARFGLS
ncbi:MAG TPA: glycosyltransferase family 2 protein [Solirubrobacteraceae bacterium]|nr:glycosyltransferase family 2 protein [Solirubrobacteraceae bacterium]